MKTINRLTEKLLSRRIMIAIAVVCMMIIAVVVSTISYSKQTTDSLSNKLIRFHVVANSDSTEDQLLKQRVRDEVIGFIEPLVKECDTVEDTRDLLEASLPVIKEIAEEVIADEHKDYSVYVALDKANFPTKAYGDIVLPAGEYDACRIVIGEGKGENWWCVMYPPLCYLDVASGVVPLEGKQQLEEELSDEQYELICRDHNNSYEIRFKLVDTINAWLHGSDYQQKGLDER